MKQRTYLMAWTVIPEYGTTGKQVCFIETTLQLKKLLVCSWIEKTFWILVLFSRSTSQQIDSWTHKISVWNGKHHGRNQEETKGWQLKAERDLLKKVRFYIVCFSHRRIGCKQLFYRGSGNENVKVRRWQ